MSREQVAQDWFEMTDHMLDGLFMTRQACIYDGVLTQKQIDDFIIEVSRKYRDKYAEMDSDKIHKAMAEHMLRSLLDRLEEM